MGISPVALGRPYYKSFRFCRSNDHTTEWINYPDALAAIVGRFKGVIIENLRAIDLLDRYDADDVLFYCDPPYLGSTRQYELNRGYFHDMTDDDHAAMLDVLHQLKGAVVLSGYPNGMPCHEGDDELRTPWLGRAEDSERPFVVEHRRLPPRPTKSPPPPKPKRQARQPRRPIEGAPVMRRGRWAGVRPAPGRRRLGLSLSRDNSRVEA